MLLASYLGSVLDLGIPCQGGKVRLGSCGRGRNYSGDRWLLVDGGEFEVGILRFCML